MNTVAGSKTALCTIRQVAMQENSPYYTRTVFEKNPITADTVSILMAASNRSKQTYHTLTTIANSAYKNVQVIVVDDSTSDPLSVSVLETYPFRIDLLVINRGFKSWHNPVVNYNLGFKYIQGGYVILQNAEVCHVGDVVSKLVEIVKEKEYYVFDVRASKSYDANEQFYKSSTHTLDVYNDESLYMMWYQHETNNRQFHFLAGGLRSVFDTIGPFSYDYTLGCAWDDNDYLLKIKAQKIAIKSMHLPAVQCGGIHQYHVIAGESWDRGRECNNKLFEKKRDYLAKHGLYIEVCEKGEGEFDERFRKLLYNTA